MNCNCNRQTTAIKWIRGNFFPYVLPITRHDTDGTVDSDGNLIWTVTDYQVMPEDEVSVVFKGSMRSYNMDFTIDANGHLVIEDNGEMPNGVYSIEVNITANNIDGMRRRWMIKDAVQLCESLTQEEMHATTLQADVFWFAKGDTGNGIEGVTLTDTVIDTETGQRTRTYTISFTESEDVIITLTDVDFDIFMDKIVDLIGQVQVNVIPYVTEGTKIAKVAGTDIYSPSTPTYDDVPTSGSDNPVKSKGIKSAIDAETSRAQGAETSIEQLISNENLRARAAETSLQNNINSESQRAQQAESVNANAISDIQQELVNLDSRIPDSLADLSEDSTHRTVTDAEKSTWNGKQDTISDLSAIRSGATAGAEAAVRPYNTQSPDGMGYLVLDKEATFASQVTTANTIYEIRYDYDLNGGSVTIPAGCVLKFVGGSLSNGSLAGDVLVSSDNVQIFNDVNLKLANNQIPAGWFGQLSVGVDCAPIINKAIDAAEYGAIIDLPMMDLSIDTPVNIHKGVTIDGHSRGIWNHKVIVNTAGITAFYVAKGSGEFIAGGVLKNVNISGNESTKHSFVGVDVSFAEHFVVSNVVVNNADIGFLLSGSNGPLYLLRLDEISARNCSSYGLYLDADGSWKNGITIHPTDFLKNNVNIRVCKGSGNTIVGSSSEIGGGTDTWIVDNDGIVIEGGIWTIKDYLWIENCRYGIWAKSGYVNIIDDLYVCNVKFEDDAVVRYRNQSLSKTPHKFVPDSLFSKAELIVCGDEYDAFISNGNMRYRPQRKGLASFVSSALILEKGGNGTINSFHRVGGGFAEGHFSNPLEKFTVLVDFKIDDNSSSVDMQLFAIYLSDNTELRVVSSRVTDGKTPRYVKLLHTTKGYLCNIQNGNTDHASSFVRYIFTVDMANKVVKQYDESGRMIDDINYTLVIPSTGTTTKFIFGYGNYSISRLFVFNDALTTGEINLVLKNIGLFDKYHPFAQGGMTAEKTSAVSYTPLGNTWTDIEEAKTYLKIPGGKFGEIQIVNSGTTGNRPSNATRGTMYFDTLLTPPRPIWYTGSGWVDATGASV